jgi:AcrR family transcriptional regulator
MATRGKKAYHSPIRQRQADQTRGAIADAARGLFVERGYAGTTIEAIGAAAGVAPQTVTAVFGNKRRLLAEVLVRHARNAEYERLTQEARDAGGRDQLTAVARITRRMYERTVEDFELLRGASGVAPELAQLVATIEDHKRQRQAVVAQQLARRRELRKGMSAGQACDIIFALTGHELYHTLVEKRGWSPSRYETWLADILSQSLLASG